MLPTKMTCFVSVFMKLSRMTIDFFLPMVFSGTEIIQYIDYVLDGHGLVSEYVFIARI